MNNAARHRLCQLIFQHGRDVCQDSRRCRALLSDYCPTARPEVHVLISALEEGVPSDLLNSANGLPWKSVRARLVARLAANRHLTPEAARWAVESWALALGIVKPKPNKQPEPGQERWWKDPSPSKPVTKEPSKGDPRSKGTEGIIPPRPAPLQPGVRICPSCQRTLHVPDWLVGQSVQCPTCEAVFATAVGGPMCGQALEVPAAAADGDPPEVILLPEDQRRPRWRNNDRPRRRHYAPHRGSTVFMLGILSIVVCTLLGPIAWIMGSQDLAEIQAGRMDPAGESATNAGRICGMIATILTLLGLALFFLLCAGVLSTPRR